MVFLEGTARRCPLSPSVAGSLVGLVGSSKDLSTHPAASSGKEKHEGEEGGTACLQPHAGTLKLLLCEGTAGQHSSDCAPTTWKVTRAAAAETDAFLGVAGRSPTSPHKHPGIRGPI